MANLLVKETEILCPRKRHLIGVLNQDLESSFPVKLSVIDFEPEQTRVQGEICKCKICDSLWITQGCMNTEHGWWPQDPKLETPPYR